MVFSSRPALSKQQCIAANSGQKKKEGVKNEPGCHKQINENGDKREAEKQRSQILNMASDNNLFRSLVAEKMQENAKKKKKISESLTCRKCKEQIAKLAGSLTFQ